MCGSPRRPAPGWSATARARRRAADRAGARLRRPAPHHRRPRGRAGDRREAGGAVHLQGPGHRRARRRRPRAAGPAARRLRRAAGSPHPGLGPAVAALPHRPGRRRRPGGGPHPQPARVPPAPDRVRAHHRPGRRGARPGAARRGLPGPHLLGRAVHLPVPEPAVPRADPGAAPLPLPAGCPRPARRPGRPATRGRCTPGRAAATAARRPSGCISTRGRAAGCPTSPTASATSTSPWPTTSGSTTRPPATCVPAGLRGRDAAGDRPLLGQHRQLRPRPRTATRSAG